jgi:hypothetical protein
MPKRTNPFQTVIFLIQKNIAGQASVTQSAELTDLVTGRKREVDVVIEAIVAGHTIRIGLECRDWERKRRPRPQTVEWVESMYGKHQALPTDRLVLVSRSGFTAEAVKKAHSYNIETVVPDEFTEARAAEMGARISRVQVGELEIVRVTKVCTVVTAIPEPITVPPEAGNLPVFIETGRFVARMRDIVMGILADRGAQHLFVNPPDHITEITINSDNPRLVIDDKPQALYLKIPGNEPQLSRLERISVSGEGRYMSSEVPLRHGRFQDAVYSWGEVVIEGRPMIVVATKANDGTSTASLA